MDEYWHSVLHSNWGIEASLSRLGGTEDLNFAASADDGSAYIMKVMHRGCARSLVEMQTAALRTCRESDATLPVPDVVPTINDMAFAEVEDQAGVPRLCWVQRRLPGHDFATFSPKTEALIGALGRAIARTDLALSEFEHPELTRDLRWNLLNASDVIQDRDVIADTKRRQILDEISAGFAGVKQTLQALPKQAIHNDFNDYNILVDVDDKGASHISGLFDFGDLCRAPRICELAIAAAYIVLDHPHPERALAAFVSGYHAISPLTGEELDLLWPLLRTRLAVSVVISAQAAIEKPDDPYQVISQAPAWRFLEAQNVNPGLLRARLRAACGLAVTSSASRVLRWLEEHRGTFAPVMGMDLSDAPMGTLSVQGSAWPENPLHLPIEEAAHVGAEYDNGAPWLGYYNEPRLIYTAPAFRSGPWHASERRTVHIAVDIFAPAGAPLFAPLAGKVVSAENRDHALDYGGVIILEHETGAGDRFFTLYGHLDPELCARLKPGDTIEAGEEFASLGSAEQNGGWAPHLHFQLALTTEGMEDDWPGVADPDDAYLWSAICPNPAALLNLPDSKVAFKPLDRKYLLPKREQHFAANLKLSYDEPALFLRGWRHYLFDEMGRPHLDAYNNVPHVGHAHPRLRDVAARQLGLLNSNTRYLHPAQIEFAEAITERMPERLSVCFFVNSGSEGNELALRLARAATGGRAMIAPDHGYHGNTTGAVDLSAYKFNAPGGDGAPDWLHLVEVADEYRGRFGRDDPDRARKFASQVKDAIGEIEAKGMRLAGFIAETYPSVGGQIIPPPGYLRHVYDLVRAAGGVCIADEVQTGLGRLGRHYFGFEEQNAEPDIVVLGKPIGNGHPIGVVVTTPGIAERFAHGPEFFSTFGGSTLSCKIGREVLAIVEEERLAENAQARGDQLLAGLRALQHRHEVIGDVRGRGLFIGVDLVTDRDSKAPATAIAAYVKNRLRARRVLTGTEGPSDNILKIRPPLTIEADDIDMLLHLLDETLSETYCRSLK